MNYDEIAEHMRERGHTWVSAAKALKKGRTTLVRTAKREIESRPVARALAALLMAPESGDISDNQVDEWVRQMFPDMPAYWREPAAPRRERLAERDGRRLADAGLI